MDYMKQFGIIAVVAIIAEILKAIIPLPVPSSVWGMLVMFFLLTVKVVKLHQVEKVADYLLAIMPILFVPYGVALAEDAELIKSNIAAIVIISVVSTIICFAVTAILSQIIIQMKNTRKEEK